jgi:hypothetical protein
MDAATITLTDSALAQRAHQKAQQLGLSLTEYVSRLVLRDTPPKAKYSRGSAGDKDPWGPVPPAVLKQWRKDIAEFEAADRKHHQPRFTSGREFVEYVRQQS